MMTQAIQIEATTALAQAPEATLHLPWIAATCVIVILWVIGHASRKLVPAGGKQ